MCMLSCFCHVQLFETLWTIAHQAPLFIRFSRQEYWSEFPFLPSGDLPNPGKEPESLRSPVLEHRFFPTSATWEAPCIYKGFSRGSDSKESACIAGELGSIPELGRSPGGGHGNPLQCSCLENPHGVMSMVGYSPWDHK